jgi:hypothetical protein
MGSRPTLEQVESMIDEPTMKKRGKQIDFVKLSATIFRTPPKTKK